MSKVIQACSGEALLRSGQDNSHQSLNQSDEKLELISTWPLAFSELQVRSKKKKKKLINDASPNQQNMICKPNLAYSTHQLKQKRSSIVQNLFQ